MSECTCAWCHPQLRIEMCQEGAVVPLDVAMMVCCQLCAASIVKGVGHVVTQWSPIQQQANWCLLICVSYGQDRCSSFTLFSVPGGSGGAKCACVRVRAHRVCCSVVSFGGARGFVYPYGSIRKEDVACDTCGGAISGAPLRCAFLCVASMPRCFCRRFRETCSSAFSP